MSGYYDDYGRKREPHLCLPEATLAVLERIAVSGQSVVFKCWCTSTLLIGVSPENAVTTVVLDEAAVREVAP